MAKFEFKQAAMLRSGPAGHGGKHLFFSKGVHDVDAKAQEHETFKHFAKAGLIVPFKVEEQGELAPAKSGLAKVSQDAAKQQLQPEAEIGGDAAPAPKKSKGK